MRQPNTDRTPSPWLGIAISTLALLCTLHIPAKASPAADGSVTITFHVEESGAPGEGSSSGSSSGSSAGTPARGPSNAPAWLVTIDDDTAPLADSPLVTIEEEPTPLTDNPLTGAPGGLRLARTAMLAAATALTAATASPHRHSGK